MTYPLEPLAQAAGITLGQIGAHQPGDPLSGLHGLATAVGTSISTLKRARTVGLTDQQADRFAIALGRTPDQIWGRLWWDQLPEDLHGAAATNNAKTHCPKGHSYDRINIDGARCCSTCQNRANRWARARQKTAA